MSKNIVLIFALITALFLLYSVVGRTPTATGYLQNTSTPHYYGKATVPIDRIEIVGLYFVPKDRTNSAISDWKEVFSAQFEKLKAFHEVQFLGRSSITYTFLPDIVVGQEKAGVYEVVTASHTDPLSIEPIAREISARLLDPAGDLWLFGKEHPATGARRVYLIMFEGDGAAGNGDVALISRAFLTDTAYAPFATTFMAHEFYHTLGLPDAYQSSSYVFQDAQQTQVGLLESEDIMGRVRVPIEYTYLDRESLSAMGI